MDQLAGLELSCVVGSVSVPPQAPGSGPWRHPRASRRGLPRSSVHRLDLLSSRPRGESPGAQHGHDLVIRVDKGKTLNLAGQSSNAKSPAKANKTNSSAQ